jgi:N-acetylneuraminic acid mutarotase
MKEKITMEGNSTSAIRTGGRPEKRSTYLAITWLIALIFVASFVVIGFTPVLAATGGSWTPTGSLITGRTDQTTTLLNNGLILVAGGKDANGNALASAELYTPSTGQWSATGSTTTARANQTATLLTNGQVLVAGGVDAQNNGLASVELYAPTTGTWSNASSMLVGRSQVTAPLLQNGQVLLSGGYGQTFVPGAFFDLAEVYTAS